MFDFNPAANLDAGPNFTLSDGQQKSYDVDPGTYTVDELAESGWDLTSISCDDANSTGTGNSTATFNVEAGETVTCTFNNARLGDISGKKYYDSNTNGQLDAGEPGIPNWPITFTGTDSGTVTTGAGGSFATSLLPGSYLLAEKVANSPWIQTGNLVDQTSASGGSSATLANKKYNLTITGGGSITGLNFGNVCLGAGGGLTLGYWSNKNGQAQIGADDLAMLRALNLRNANGSNFDPTTKAQVKTWLLSATATNMAYMLSAQLAAMELNVFNGKVSGSSLIYAPGTQSANANGFATVNAVMAEANAELGAHGVAVNSGAIRTYQEALKNALDRANNNLNFVQSGPSKCPAPIFP